MFTALLASSAFGTFKDILFGFFKAVWEVAKTCIQVPIGIIVALVIAHFVLQHNATYKAARQAVVKYVAAAEVARLDAINKSKQDIIDELSLAVTDLNKQLDEERKNAEQFEQERIEAESKNDVLQKQIEGNRANNWPKPTPELFDELRKY